MTGQLIEYFRGTAELEKADGAAEEPVVVNNPDKSRYELRLGDRMVGVAAYRRRNGRIAFTHTEVDESCSGRGFGSALIRAALDDAKQQGLEVRPLCPFVAHYIRRPSRVREPRRLGLRRHVSAHRHGTARRQAAFVWQLSSFASSECSDARRFAESFEAVFVSSNGSFRRS